MSIMALRPWTEMVKLHPDVEAGELTEATFAIDLGAIAARDPNVPVVNRDARAFFAATHITTDLGVLLEEVLASLAGKPGYNRVVKLRTPFGGGKSHTLAALLHACRDRAALDAVPGAGRFANPGEVAVAVFDGEKLDARDGKSIPGGPCIQTMWGWLAWQIGGEEAFSIVAGHDGDRVAPGGDVIADLLTKGSGGRPVLLLLDEVLKYMERAAAVAVLDSTLQRQTKDFFQNLTVEVSGSERAAMVYSLQWSAREALGNIGLLGEIDKLASRVDQLREPVSGDEVLPVLQRRLLGADPNRAVAEAVAEAYAATVTNLRRAWAETAADRQLAEEEGMAFREHLAAAYPFHPALIEAMRDRWTAIDAFQRTRGALRFLGTCLHASKAKVGARPLLGPGDIPLSDPQVRLAMLKELGAQNNYDPVISADIEGPSARARRIDDRMARERPELGTLRPAARLATAILVYSFGGLSRPGEEEPLPAGITEAELLAACVGPDLDDLTARVALAELRNACLFLHYDGVRYCFKKDPNVTKLIEDAEQEVARNPEEVRAKIREMLNTRLAGVASAIVWPSKPQDVPDKEPRFLVGYLPLEFAAETAEEQRRQAVAMLTLYGDRPRSYRNAIALAVPDKKQVETVRRAVRYLLAAERVEGRKKQWQLTKDQLDQLGERKRSENAAAESAFRALYSSVWLPRVENGGIGIEAVDAEGRSLQATGVHERVMELLTAVGIRRVFSTVQPHKVVERLRLGEAAEGEDAARLWVRLGDVRDAFFAFLEPPRLDDIAALQSGIARGVAEGAFGYATGPTPTVGPDGRLQIARERVALGRPIAEDEVDFDSGFLIHPAAVPEEAPALPPERQAAADGVPSKCAEDPGATGHSESQTSETTEEAKTTTSPGVVRFRFRATRDQMFKAFPAIANLADHAASGKVSIEVEASAEDAFDPTWLRNAVTEPLEEADIDLSNNPD